MNTIPVFRKGLWILYTVPEANQHTWSQSLKLQTASLYATAITRGYSQETSTIFAECFANKELYGVTYNTTIEKQLESFLI
jgi:hypothetical protein